ncbi:MAG: 30S ribosomal protein S13 [Candidatus Calescibacterium sp.]|nr:30S ribosomal protein S13 [Candidatus Calescibacterium sp.]MCX7972717.1 30S ribosomal protein S13 [bacterium]MDW8195521.1 30S ribosomal protein S13 [Candidatus Calescibacterium sp.]
MPRIAGVNIPENKQLWISLRYIYGIGPTRAMEILKNTNIDPYKKAKDLTQEEINKIQKYIDDNYVVEGDLRRQISQNIRELIEIRCYRGIRHQKGLPVRGQRTRTNARTRKGPKPNRIGTRKK